MAIKGKKKARGSQARRRPAPAPRPQAHAAPHTPWYRTSTGRVVSAVALVLVLALIGGLVAKVRGDANERSRVRAALEEYTDEVRLLQQQAAPSGTAMMAAPVTPADPGFEGLRSDAGDWTEAFEAAVSGSLEVPAPEGAFGSDGVFRQALALYAAAARTYQLAAGLQGEDAQEALARAAEQRDRASAIWGAAAGILDSQRGELDLPPTGIPAPAQSAPEAPFEIEGGDEGAEDEDGSGGGDE